ncbi:MAG: PocR ligand-binding domain-containing protein, partial [Firmicutes bacterium]|nr:PocR ligand-binding domain-containing protein [Bacillota bacterium]
ITDKVNMEEALRESEKKVRAKLEAVLSPEGDLGSLSLTDILNLDAIQAMMDNFNYLTDTGMAILDLDGKILISTGWQDICSKFHRVHPITAAFCHESDIVLSQGVKAGEYKIHKCKNNMWDMVTPIFVGGKHLGNLFLGQFLYSNEEPDYQFFRQRARIFDFDEEEYIKALDKVPRWSEETVKHIMSFYSQFTSLISNLSYATFKLARLLEERKREEETLTKTVEALSNSEEMYRSVLENISDVYFRLDNETNVVMISPSLAIILGYDSVEEILKEDNSVIWHDLSNRDELFEKMYQGKVSDFEVALVRKDGGIVYASVSSHFYYDKDGNRAGVEGIFRDISERKRMEKTLRTSEKMYRTFVENSQEAMFVVQRGIIKYANPGCCEITGYTAEQLTGSNVYRLLPEEEAESVKAVYEKFLSGEVEKTSNTVRLISPGGIMQVLRINSFRIDWEGSPATLNFASIMI